ncbi:hypothetical protein Tco_0708249 [Tanacetum coccineum]
MQNPKDILDPTTAIDVTLLLMAKAFTLNDTTPTNNNQRSSSNPSNMHIAQPVQNVGNQVVLNASQNPGVQNVGNQNALSVVSEIANQHGDGNVVTARAEGNSNGINGNPIRCYICQGEDHYASNCTVKPRKQDSAYLQEQMQITQKEEAGIQLTSEEFNFMATAGACKETERANANCTFKNNLQSAEVHLSENCYDNDIFNMFTQEEQYTELLEPIPEPHKVQQNDSNVIFAVSSVEQGGGIVEQHSATVEETCTYHESLFHNLAAEVEKVNSVNHKMKQTNVELTTELARYKSQEKCFDISQEKYEKLESFDKQIKTLNEEILNLNNQLSKEKSTVSFLQEERKKLKNDFKTREDELRDKQILLENMIKELDNILVKTGKSIQMMHMLSPKPDSFYHAEQKMALGYQNPFYLKQAQKKQQSLYNEKVLLEKHDPPVVNDSEETLQLAQETKFVRDFKSLAKEADESLAKHKGLKFKIERLLRTVVSQDIMSIVQTPTVVETFDLQTELERKPPSSSGSKLYSVTPFPKSKGLPKIDESHALSKPVTSNSVPTPTESKVVKNDNVISPGIFRINPFTASRDVKSATRTRRPQPRNNPKNDKVPSKSKSSWLSNNLEKIEENHRNLQSSSNQKHMSSECNNIKLAIWNAKSEVVCAMCKQCLITVNHDVYVLNYVNDMNSRALNKNANVSNVENQKKHKPKVRKPKKVGSKERLDSPKPSTPRYCLRWSPTGRIFNLIGKIMQPVNPCVNLTALKDKEDHGDNECDI